MRKIGLAIIISLAGTGALAQEPTGPSRYSFNRVGEGFLRLDTVSGQVAHCSSTSAGWACQAVPEDRAALEKEIARLQDEIAALKQSRDVAAPRPPADLTTPEERSNDAKQIREDIERARVAIENAWKRLVDIIVTFQKDMMRKG